MIFDYVHTFSVENRKIADQSGNASSDKQVDSNSANNVDCVRPTFTIKQEQKYARRCEEGFDLPDERYELS